MYTIILIGNLSTCDGTVEEASLLIHKVASYVCKYSHYMVWQLFTQLQEAYIGLQKD